MSVEVMDMEGMTVSGVRITREAAIRVIETVLDAGHTHGLGYWGKVSNVREKDGHVVSFSVTEHEPYAEGQEARTRRVTTAEIGPAICRLMNQSNGGWMKQLAADEIDGPLCDAIVQVACFDEVIYG